MFFEELALGHVPSTVADERPASEGETDAAHPAAEALVATEFGRLATRARHVTTNGFCTVTLLSGLRTVNCVVPATVGSYEVDNCVGLM